MLAPLLLGACLLLGQSSSEQAEPPSPLPPSAIPSSPAPAAPATAAPAPPTTIPERWLLMRELQGTWLGAGLDGNRMFVNGWVQMSFTASTDAISNQPLVWNDRANEFLLQQAWVRFGQRVVTSGTTAPTVGYQLDVLAGSDYRFTLPRGLFNSQLINSTGAQNLYGVDLIQQYASLYVPTLFQGVEFRLGRVYSPICPVESNEGVSSPLLSRLYTFNYDPFTHCGLVAYVTFTPEWSVLLMLANGNDVYFGDPAEELRFVGSLKWTQPGGGRNILQLDTSMGRGKFVAAFPFPTATVGATANEPLGRNNANVVDGTWTHVFSPVLTSNLGLLFGYQTNVPGIALPNNYGTATWASATQYLTYTLSPRVTAIIRTEAFDDFQGQRTGFEGVYLAATAALVFKPRTDIQVRHELRYDYNPASAPFEGKHQLFTAGTDVIFRW